MKPHIDARDAAPPLVSVIVPAYNAERTLSATLRSALAQTYRRLEIIVVDDGSSDRTASIAYGFREQDDRIVVIEQTNAGVAAARNAGLAASVGALVAPLDADDLWHPEKIARQLARFAENPDAAMIYCWSADIDEDDIVVEMRSEVVHFENDVLAPMLIANFIDSSSVPLLRRDAVIEADGWDESLHREDAQGCEDWMLYARIAARHSVFLVPAFLVGYRQSPAAMSRNVDRMKRSMKRIHAEARGFARRVPPWVYRWSRAGFDHYTADMLQEDGHRAKALAHRVKAVMRDPAWLASRMARRRLKGWLFGEPAYPPVGGGCLHFADIDPDLERFPPRDRWTRRRDARLLQVQPPQTEGV